VFDIRKKDLLARSDNMECELSSVCIMKNGKKVMVGMDDGVIGIFNWGDWGDIKDRFPTGKVGIQCMINRDQDFVYFGNEEGVISQAQLHPNQIVRIVGQHAEYPIECIALSEDQSTLASLSHDQVVKVWSAVDRNNDESDDEPRRKKPRKSVNVQREQLKSFFADLNESDSE
jgi:WD40 repeat protein